MKKSISIILFIWMILFRGWSPETLSAQLITVPDYCYGYVESEHDNVLSDGTARYYPYAKGSYGPAERTTELFLAKGFRWWNYTGPGVSCYHTDLFDYPGFHGIPDRTGILWSGIDPPVGYCAGWGGVIVDPEEKKILCLNGAANYRGPTEPNFIKTLYGIMWYQPPTYWGESTSYGYLRKTVLVQSTGALQQGDSVLINTTIRKELISEGEGTITSIGMMFLNKISETTLYKMGGGDYLALTDMDELSFNPLGILDNMGAVIRIEGSESEKDSTIKAAVGDTIVMELMFKQEIKLFNPGEYLFDIESWAGEKPEKLFSAIEYIHTDSVKNLVREHSNALSYDMTCLSQGAILTSLTPGGPNVDEDNDGISDSREKGPENDDSTFDGNADGIPDYKQTDVASFHTYDGLNYVTLSVPAGIVLSEMKVTNNPSPANTPDDAEFPWGFFDFSLDGLDPGEAITVTLTLHNGEPTDKYYKYGMTPDNLEPHWYDFAYDGQTGAQINTNVITLHFVDGLRGDEDITQNGSVKEPGGPAKTSTTGVAELTDEKGLLIYPVPSKNLISFKLNNIPSLSDYCLCFYSVNGSLVYQQTVDVIEGNQEFTVAVDQLPAGIYIVTLTRDNIYYKSKFIIVD